MYRLLWLIPLSLIALAMWLPSLIPAAVLAVIGWVALTLIGVGLVVLGVLRAFAGYMAS